MKIISLQAENLKRLVAVEIKPNGNMVEITGKNGNGKTSVLDAIWWALCGTSNVQSRPIRDGAEEAVVKLDMGDLVVTRTFKRKDDTDHATKLKVEAADGARYPNPQSVLDKVIGALSFDPSAFIRASRKDQVGILKNMVPGDFDDIAAKRKKAFDERTEVNRDEKRVRAAADAIEIPDGVPDARVDTTQLANDLSAINAAISDRDRKVELAAAKRARAEEVSDEIGDLKARIATLEATSNELSEAATRLEQDVKEIGGIKDPADIQRSLSNADVTNRLVDQAEHKRGLEAEANELKDESDGLTKTIQECDRRVVEMVEQAQLPVPGLSLTEDSVMLNGIPFDQASDAEQLQVSLALAAAANPKLRVIRVRDGSLLDDDAMEHLAEFAEANDFQVWIERVDSSGTVGFVIEDGLVKGQVE